MNSKKATMLPPKHLSWWLRFPSFFFFSHATSTTSAACSGPRHPPSTLRAPRSRCLLQNRGRTPVDPHRTSESHLQTPRLLNLPELTWERCPSGSSFQVRRGQDVEHTHWNTHIPIIHVALLVPFMFTLAFYKQTKSCKQSHTTDLQQQNYMDPRGEIKFWWLTAGQAALYWTSCVYLSAVVSQRAQQDIGDYENISWEQLNIKCHKWWGSCSSACRAPESDVVNM